MFPKKKNIELSEMNSANTKVSSEEKSRESKSAEQVRGSIIWRKYWKGLINSDEFKNCSGDAKDQLCCIFCESIKTILILYTPRESMLGRRPTASDYIKNGIFYLETRRINRPDLYSEIVVPYEILQKVVEVFSEDSHRHCCTM